MATKTVYPEHYTEEDIANYDYLISQGMNLIGKKIKKEDEWLLDLSAKITINQQKGLDNGLTQEEVNELRELHKKNAQAGVIHTPKDYFYDGLIHPSNGDKPYPHPLAKSAEEYNAERIRPSKDVIDPPPVYENENNDVIEF